MMKKVFSLFFILLFAISLNLQAQDLDEILENYYEVTGIEKVSEIETMVSSGKVVQMGMEFPMKLYQKRPGKVRMEAEIQGTKMVQAFDGETGWSVLPWTGSTEPQDMSEDQLKAMKQMGDMEGDLYNWKDKGFIVNLEGEDEMEGTPVFKIKLEKEDGDVFTYFLDAENFVILKVDSKVKVQGTEVESSSFYSNFKQIEGMVMPYNIETRVNDQVQMQVVIEDIQVDTVVDDALFSKVSSSEE